MRVHIINKQLKRNTALVQPSWKTLWQFLKVPEPGKPFDPLLGIYPKDCKLFYYKDTCTRVFIAALFTIANT